MYVGIEVTIGGILLLLRTVCISLSLTVSLGWIITFIIGERGGGSNAGYISTGFFGGQSSPIPYSLPS